MARARERLVSAFGLLEGSDAQGGTNKG